MSSIILLTITLAQLACGSYEQVTAQLKSQYSESLVGSGASGGAIYEVWVSEETGTWTILGRGAGGLACLMKAGTGWTLPADEPKGDPA